MKEETRGVIASCGDANRPNPPEFVVDVKREFIKKKISKDTLAPIKKWGAKVGIKIIQLSIIKYAVPVASILIGGTWNDMTTARIGRLATSHFRKNRKERVGQAWKRHSTSEALDKNAPTDTGNVDVAVEAIWGLAAHRLKNRELQFGAK